MTFGGVRYFPNLDASSLASVHGGGKDHDRNPFRLQNIVPAPG